MYERRFYLHIIWLPCVFFSLDTKVLKPSHRFMTYVEDIEQLNKFFYVPICHLFQVDLVDTFYTRVSV